MVLGGCGVFGTFVASIQHSFDLFELGILSIHTWGMYYGNEVTENRIKRYILLLGLERKFCSTTCESRL